jgi:hypothetical protein
MEMASRTIWKGRSYRFGSSWYQHEESKNPVTPVTRHTDDSWS